MFDGLKDLAVFLVTGAFTFVAYEVRQARKSVTRLNLNVARILERIQGHEKVLDRHDERITNLERD